jgi:hypothetical protein
MKRASVTLAAIVAALCVLSFALQAADSPPATKLVSGEVVSLYGYLAKGLRGAENRDAGVFQIESRGLPVAILEDGTGELWVAVYKGPTSAASKLAPFVGAKVNAQGPAWTQGGVNLIEIQVVAEQ